MAASRHRDWSGRALLVALVVMASPGWAQSEKPPTVSTPKKAAASEKKSPAAAPSPPPPGSLPAVETLDESLQREAELIGINPRRGRGTRTIAIAPLGDPPVPPFEEDAGKATPPARETSSSTTKPPVRGEPDSNHRRQVALGPTTEDLLAGKTDEELMKMREAELVLFPRPLPGLVPGWSWDLPQPVESSLPEIVTGAPAAVRAIVPREAEPAPVASWLRGLVMPNIPVRMENRVLRYLSFYREAPRGREIARIWAKKSGRYSGIMRASLAKAGLPSDLVWLSLIESGHNATIVSPAGAAGLWQFMPDSGRFYGLTVDRWIDERLDPERATEAACRYLSDLYRRFGSWELAMAAYNMGYGGLSRAVRKYNTNDFWELSRYEAGLPWETTLYVPKILATAIVMTNRRAFGLDDIVPDAPDKFDTVLVGAGMPLSQIARLAGVPEAVIESLNPQYLAGRTPPTNRGKSWPVRVPSGSGELLNRAIALATPEDESLFAYVARAGDSIESIARTRGTTEAVIRAINRVAPNEVLTEGTVLLVPKNESGSSIADDTLVVVPPRSFTYADRRRVFYRVVPGDSIARVATLFRIPQGDIQLWNAIDANARLTVGITLQLYVPKRQSLAHVRHLPEERARILVAGSPEFFDYFEGQNGKKRLVVRAKAKDTLAGIGKRYGMTVGSMERVNRRSRSDALKLGEPIVVYTERSTPAPGDAMYVDAIARAVTSTPPAARAGSVTTGALAVD